MPATDASLIDLAKRGDHDAFDAAIRPLLRPAYRLAFGLLLNRTDAEDALQDATLTAWRRVGNLRDGAELGPWFYAIVANKCRSIRDSHWWRVLKPGDLVPATGAEWQAQGEDLRRALRRLDHAQRTVVVLHYYLDLPLDQVAATVGVPVGTAKSRLHRAITALRADPALAEATT